MKLKEVLANTLPRVKKAKRKCPQSPQESSGSASSSSGHLSGRDCVNAKDCLNVVTCNRSLVTEDFRYLKDAATSTTPPQSRREPFSVNLNLQLHSTNGTCGCYQTSTRQYPSDDYSLSDTEFKGGDCSDGNYNTIPKARSRIRTNPWLPSPKTSPPLSPPSTPVTSPSSPLTSCTTSPLHTALTPMSLTPESMDSACMDTSFSASSDHSSLENFRIRPLRPGARDKKRKAKMNCRVGKDSSADSLSDADSLLQQSYSSDMMDTSMSAGDIPDSEPATVCGPIRGEQLTIDIQQGIISIHTEPTDEVMSPVSFEYEDALETTLESPGVGRFVGSRDSLNWANRDSCLLEDVHFHLAKESALRESDEDQATDIAEDPVSPRASVSEHRGSTDGSSGTLCCDIPPKSPNFTELQDEVFDSCSNETYKENTRLKEQESMDSGFSSAQLSDNQDVVSEGKRTIREIRSSLQEKVHRLRQEKRLVDEKIREAQEEERMRMKYISRFQHQVTAIRKQVLLETLDRLKDRLAQQSQRLQTCYDTVLNRQWSEARAKRQRTLPRCASSADHV